MSKLSKRIRKILSQQIEERYKLMDNKVYRVIKKVRSGLKVGKEVNDAVKMLEDAKKAKDKVEDTVKAVDSAAKVLDATKIAAEASRKLVCYLQHRQIQQLRLQELLKNL